MNYELLIFWKFRHRVIVVIVGVTKEGVQPLATSLYILAVVVGSICFRSSLSSIIQ